MIIGITGAFAVGKSYFVAENMDRWADLCPSIHVVQADYASEYRLSVKTNTWIVKEDVTVWKKTQEQKLDHLNHMLYNGLYVIESARYFGGLDKYLLDIKDIRKYLKFIVAYTDSTAMKLFMKERCKIVGKKFNEPYWELNKLEYECKTRYINTIVTRYRKYSVEVKDIYIDKNRNGWGAAEILMEGWINENCTNKRK